MKKYTQLTCEQRYHIYLLHKQGYSQTFIAKSMNRDKSTISRELSRNIGKRGYRHKQADRLACERHQKKNKHIKLNAKVIDYISEKLKLYWSPQQIVGRLELDENIKISTETAYRFVLKDKAVGGELYKYLRHQHKKYRKRYGKNDYRGKIPNRIDIEERPSIVDTRSRIGDWEVDLVIGKGHKGGFATLAERKSRLYLVLPINNKTARTANDAITKLLTPLKHWVKTLTFDNGREFSWHDELAKTLNCGTYFAKPYHSWERGLNENHNGLLRQFFPKQMALDNVSEKEAFKATDLMNNRPRKCLGYKTPFEVFAELTGKDYFLNGSVALMG
jgi:transposase, IS30 family